MSKPGDTLNIFNTSEVRTDRSRRSCFNEWNTSSISCHAQITECPICLEPIRDPKYVTPCLHSFHSACLKKWICNNSSCPVCRHVIVKRAGTSTEDTYTYETTIDFTDAVVDADAFFQIIYAILLDVHSQ